MGMNVRFFIILLCGTLSFSVHAQNGHWTYDPYAYQYDMTAYVAISINGVSVADYADYEIAAFCGDECRGVAQIQQAESDGVVKSYGYLRIRSNQSSGEIISFKVYQKSVTKEVDIYQTTIEFQSQQLVGLPSSPLQLRVVQKGDVNGDGQVDTQDAIKVIQYYLGKNPDDFVLGAADVTDDGVVDTQDAIQIIRTYLNK